MSDSALAHKLATAWAVGIGLLYPFTAKRSDKIDVKYPMHYIVSSSGFSSGYKKGDGLGLTRTLIYKSWLRLSLLLIHATRQVPDMLCCANREGTSQPQLSPLFCLILRHV